MDMKAYLDNAATTPLDPDVIDAITDCMSNIYGNPSATHSAGRNARGVIESSRVSISKLINAKPKEIIFTSGGTEGDNIALRCAVKDLGVKHIITSPTEHKAVLETAKELAKEGLCEVHLVEVDEVGRPELTSIADLAAAYPGSLISLMHANNEIGTKIDLEVIGNLAKEFGCYFHSDTVQTLGHYPIDTKAIKADFLTCSAHKLNGPKGIGFLYVNEGLRISSLFTGGGQERNIRAGTENVSGIVGLAKSMEIAQENMAEEEERIQNLKSYFIEQLTETIPEIAFNGDLSPSGSLYTVLNVSVPPTGFNDLLLFKLDMEGVYCSGGSACNSGAAKGSHVLEAIGHPSERQGIRFSFGRFTKKDDVDFAIDKLAKILKEDSATSRVY